MTESVPPPIVLSFLPCEAFVLNPRMQRFNVMGVLTQVHASEYPLRVPQLQILLELTAVRLRTVVEFRMLDPEDEPLPLEPFRRVVEAYDPRAIHTITAGWPDVVLPRPGSYTAECSIGSSVVVQRRIMFFEGPLRVYSVGEPAG